MTTNAEKKKSWCPIPWVGISTNPAGQFRLCVQANSDKTTRGLFWNKQGEPFTGKAHSLSEARNAELAKDVRQTMLKGEKHSACVRCHSDEANGLGSKRQWALAKHVEKEGGLTFEACVKQTEKDGSIDPNQIPMKEVDLRLGNRCNFACRSCYPGESSGWYNEWFDQRSKVFSSGEHRIELEKVNGTVRPKNKDLDWVKDSRLMQTFAKDTKELINLQIVGGEPLLIEEHFETLQSLIDLGRADFIEVDYNSNISVLPHRVLKLWSHFRKIRLGYSIDGAGEVNDYIRYPAKWSRLEENIQKLDDSDLTCLEMWPTVTVMAYNILDIPNIISWQIHSQFKKQNFDPSCLFLVQHPLRFPEHLSSQILPKKAKEQVSQEYKNYKEQVFPQLVEEFAPQGQQALWENRLNQIFTSILNYMNSEDRSHLIPQFLEETRKMDEYRDQSFRKALPQLAEILI